MKFNCPNCGIKVKLTVEEIQKPQLSTICPGCKKEIILKNNLPVSGTKS